MAPRQLMVRFRKYKMQKRKTQPKAFASKASGGLSRHAMRENAAFRYNDRGGGRADAAVQRLEHFIKTRKPHHRILYWIFNPAIRHASEEMFKEVQHDPPIFEGKREYFETPLGYGYSRVNEVKPSLEEQLHPKMAAELLLERYMMQDETLKVFAFECILLESSPMHNVWLFFRGRECFGIYRKNQLVYTTIMYSDIMVLKKHLWKRRATWAGEPVKLDPNSLAELET